MTTDDDDDAKTKRRLLSSSRGEKMISRSGCRRRDEKMSSRKAMTTTNGTMTIDDFDVEKVKSGIRETIERISGKVAEMSGVTEKNLTFPSSSVEDTSIFVHNQLASAVKALENFEQSLDPLMMHSMETIAERHPVLAGAFAAFASGSFSVAVARWVFKRGALDEDDLPKRHDSEKIAKYWARRPIAVMKRSAGLLTEVLTWATALVGDVTSNTVEQNAPIRAKALKELIARQGAAFVKVGQAVAIRPDLLPPAYLEEFQTLLDQVEAFPSEDARKLIQKTIGENVRLEDVFEDVSCFDKPVARRALGKCIKRR